MEIKIENTKAAIIISNLKCVDCPGDPKMHIGFDVSFELPGYKFSTNFSEMLWDQFNVSRGSSQISDEFCHEKRLIIDRDKISLQIKQDHDDELADMQLHFVLKVDQDRIDDFKIELNAYINYVLRN